MAASESSFWTVVGSKLALALPEAAGVLPPEPLSEALVQAERARAPTARTVAALSVELLRKEREICIIFLPFVAGEPKTKSVHSVSPNKRCTSQKTKFHYWITIAAPFASLRAGCCLECRIPAGREGSRPGPAPRREGSPTGAAAGRPRSGPPQPDQLSMPRDSIIGRNLAHVSASSISGTEPSTTPQPA